MGEERVKISKPGFHLREDEKKEKNIPRRQTMPVHALITTIRTSPEPTILAILDGLDKVLAHLVRRRLGIAMLAHDDLTQLLLIPIIHTLLLLGSLLVVLVLALLALARVRVQRLLGTLHADAEVMRELALAALFAGALFEKLAHDRLGIDAERHLLHLHGLEQLGGLLLGLQRGRGLLFALQLLGLFALGLGALGVGFCGGDLLDLALGGAALFVLHAEGFVDGDFGRFGLLLLAFWWHGGWLVLGLGVP